MQRTNAAGEKIQAAEGVSTAAFFCLLSALNISASRSQAKLSSFIPARRAAGTGNLASCINLI